jgi:hypothetical protein
VLVLLSSPEALLVGSEMRSCVEDLLALPVPAVLIPAGLRRIMQSWTPKTQRVGNWLLQAVFNAQCEFSLHVWRIMSRVDNADS